MALAKMTEHPALYIPVFRRYIRVLLVSGLLQYIWCIGLFAISVNPPDYLLEDPSHKSFHAGVVYSIYSGLHCSYMLICVFFSWFLGSRGWLRAAFFANAIPGPGALFGLIQLYPCYRIYKHLDQLHWKVFFDWYAKHQKGLV